MGCTISTKKRITTKFEEWEDQFQFGKYSITEIKGVSNLPIPPPFLEWFKTINAILALTNKKFTPTPLHLPHHPPKTLLLYNRPSSKLHKVM